MSTQMGTSGNLPFYFYFWVYFILFYFILPYFTLLYFVLFIFLLCLICLFIFSFSLFFSFFSLFFLFYFILFYFFSSLFFSCLFSFSSLLWLYIIKMLSAGFEPATLALLAPCSTDWAMRALQNMNIQNDNLSNTRR